MELQKYMEAKERGAVELKKYGDSFQCVRRKFDPDTGKETMPEVSVFTMQQLNEQRAALQKMLGAVDAMLAEIKALEGRGMTPPAP